MQRGVCFKSCSATDSREAHCEHPKSSLSSTVHLAAGPSPYASFDTSNNPSFRKSQDSAIKRLENLAKHFSAGLGSNDN